MKPPVAGFIVRALAFLIDKSLFCLLALIGLWMAWSQAGGLAPAFGKNLFWWLFFVAFFFVPLWWLYLSLTSANLGTTLGKLAAGLRVVDAKGKNISFGLALFRYAVGYTVSWLVFGAGFLWIIIDPKNRSWHDQFTGTRVVGRPRPWRAVATLSLLVFFEVFLFVSLVKSIVGNQDFIRQLIEIYQDSVKLIENA